MIIFIINGKSIYTSSNLTSFLMYLFVNRCGNLASGGFKDL